MQFRAFAGRVAGYSRYFSHSPKRLIDLTNSLLPRSTGAGPFIELPTVEPIGEPGTALRIQLPESSTLNIRTTSLTALNGNISDISGDLKSLTSKIWYQSVRLSSPMCLLVSGATSGANNYSVINVKKGDKWELANVDNLVAWAGYDLSVSPKANGLRTSLLCEGTGFLVINGFHNVLDLTIGENEQILLNPNSLIASNVSLNRLARLGVTSISNFNSKGFAIPFPLRAVYAKYSTIVKSSFRSSAASLGAALGLHQNVGLSTERWQQRLREVQKWLSLTVRSRIFNTAPLYYSVVGPARILVIDRCQVPNRLNFTKSQIVEHSNL